MTNGAIYCNRCGAPNAARAKFCANCGTPLETVEPTPPGAAEPTPPAQSPVGLQATTGLAAPAAAVHYAGFWVRFVAFLIDAVLVGLVVAPISAVIQLAIGVAGGAVMMPTIGVGLVRGIVGSVFSVAVNWLYEAVLESSSYQATVGKMALGLKVTDLEYRRISFARATGRHFAKILSAMILFIGFFMIGFTERKQGLHDMIAGTYVIHGLQ
jgi:uncharacterized RDD family membrane protein YckC